MTINLQQYNFSANENITQKLAEIYAAHGKIDIKLPSDPINLYVDFLDLDECKYFNIVSGHGARLSATSAKMFRIVDPEYVFVDRINIDGGYSDSAQREVTHGLFGIHHISKSNISGVAEFNCNISNTIEFGIDVRGGPYNGKTNKLRDCIINGRYENSGLRLNSGIHHCKVSALCTDDLGVGTQQINGSWYKRRGCYIHQCDTVDADLMFRYGDTSWLLIANNYAKLRCSSENLGYRKDGTEVSLAGRLTQQGKVDTGIGFYDIWARDVGSRVQHLVSCESTPGPTNNVNIAGFAPHLDGRIYETSNGNQECENNSISGHLDWVGMGHNHTAHDLICNDLVIYESVTGDESGVVTLHNVKAKNGITVRNENYKVTLDMTNVKGDILALDNDNLVIL